MAMTKTKKTVLIIFLILILGILGSVAYILFGGTQNRNPFTIVPNDAMYVIETSNLTEGWSTLSDSKLWKSLMQSEKFKDISESAASMDSLIKGNETMDYLFSDRQLLISAHMISSNNYDFLFVVDLKKSSKISLLKDYLGSIVGQYNYQMNKRDFKGTEILEFKNNTSGEILYVSFIDNLFVGSYSPVILEASILQKDKTNFLIDGKYKEVASEIGTKKLFSFYINYSLLSKFMKCYMNEESDMVNSLQKSLAFSAFNFNFEKERLNVSGYTSINDSVSSYLKALSDVDPGKMSAYDVVSDKAAIYVAMCFDNFDSFYEKLVKEFSSEKSADYESYSKNIETVEKYFKVSLKEDFFSWIGTEISYVKLRPNGNSKEDDMVVVINTKDIGKAKEGLNHLTERVRKRSPMKFEAVNYKDYEINYLDIKGFFKMFFGKLFGKLQKPYFTYIDNYVVFSNTPSNLMDMIDDYSSGKTLGKNKAFTDFKDNFETKSNATVFVQMPNMYSHLYFHSNAEKRKGISKNKDLILSFVRIGFQMVSDGKKFKTTLIADHDENASKNSELEKFEAAAEELFKDEYESLGFKPVLTSEELAKDGSFKNEYSNGKTKSEGTIKDGAFEGTWKTYYESGNLKSTSIFENGKANGIAKFYYDSEEQNVKAQMTFKDDLIEGDYTEYYENGSKKAFLEYDEGKPDGKADFYYDSGKIKIQGKYKDGEKEGKWKFFTEIGDIYDKQKLKKGKEKKKK
ncbi:MAG: DUF3352 domain-containing protein [Bacteroidetes bacterium]|nr:DUF3352 domain-containing protein [Bacteroidota bacterium]